MTNDEPAASGAADEPTDCEPAASGAADEPTDCEPAASGAADEPTDREPTASGAADEAVDRPASVGENDLAWPVPMAAMVPLALGFGALLVWAFGADVVLVSLLPFAAFLAVMTVIDLRELRIPDKLTGPAAVLAVPLLAVASLSDWPETSLVGALLGALAMGGFYFLLFFIYPPGMGFGDVKLAPIIGAQLGFFGWIPVVRGVIAAYFIVGPVAVVFLIFGRARMKTGFPFGPFMALGAIAALVLEGLGR